jgi:hypothetical protein
MDLLACFNDPAHTPIEVFEFDPITGSVSNPSNLTPPLGPPGNFIAFAIPLDDDLGETRGIVACIRQQLGFAQRWVFTGGLDGGGVDLIPDWFDWFDSPLNASFVGGDQVEGGQLVVANAGLPVSALPRGSIDAVGTFTTNTIASTQGGWFEVILFGPPGDLGVMAIALDLGTPTAVAGFLNLLAIDPAGILGIFFAGMPRGVARQSVFVPPTSPIDLAMQSASLQAPPGQQHGFANPAWFSVRNP